MPPDMMILGAKPACQRRGAWIAAFGSKLPRVRMRSAGRGGWTSRIKSQAVHSAEPIAESFQAITRPSLARHPPLQAISDGDDQRGEHDHEEAEHGDGADDAALLDVEHQHRH